MIVIHADDFLNPSHISGFLVLARPKGLYRLADNSTAGDWLS
ncbi:hypothetical protein [Arthrobacter sp. Br18]|nr:hypothetical protein [Arthrobacter sp. Br18]